MWIMNIRTCTRNYIDNDRTIDYTDSEQKQTRVRGTPTETADAK